MESGTHNGWAFGAYLIALLAGACSPAATNDANGPAQANPEQAGFGLPPAIVRALGTDERVLDCAQGTKNGVSRFQPDWVGAERVDLNDDGRPDWIVQGRNACLRDGDAPYWWAYADEAAGQRLILPAVSADALVPADNRTQGFRDLRLRRGGADAVARYEGAAYAVPAATAGHAAPDAAQKRIGTIAGALEIAELPRAANGQDAFAVRLAGKELRRTGGAGDFADFPVPRVLHRYPQGIAPFDETIVFQQDMRGNACDGGPLWILGLKRDGTYAISDPVDFCGGKAPQLSATREQLTIVLPGGPLNRGEGRLPTETWRYRDGKLTRVP